MHTWCGHIIDYCSAHQKWNLFAKKSATLALTAVFCKSKLSRKLLKLWLSQGLHSIKGCFTTNLFLFLDLWIITKKGIVDSEWMQMVNKITPPEVKRKGTPFNWWFRVDVFPFRSMFRFHLQLWVFFYCKVLKVGETIPLG